MSAEQDMDTMFYKTKYENELAAHLKTQQSLSNALKELISLKELQREMVGWVQNFFSSDPPVTDPRKQFAQVKEHLAHLQEESSKESRHAEVIKIICDGIGYTSFTFNFSTWDTERVVERYKKIVSDAQEAVTKLRKLENLIRESFETSPHARPNPENLIRWVREAMLEYQEMFTRFAGAHQIPPRREDE